MIDWLIDRTGMWILFLGVEKKSPSQNSSEYIARILNIVYTIFCIIMGFVLTAFEGSVFVSVKQLPAILQQQECVMTQTASLPIGLRKGSVLNWPVHDKANIKTTCYIQSPQDLPVDCTFLLKHWLHFIYIKNILPSASLVAVKTLHSSETGASKKQ